jgi:uncharacterized membrane protein YeaQ/YmgE (transglycosylase-associated protein family)
VELITTLAIGILAGQLASFMYGGYSIGAIGNGIAGITGAMFTGKYLATVFGISQFAGMFLGGLVGAFVILVVFSAAEALFSKKRLF